MVPCKRLQPLSALKWRSFVSGGHTAAAARPTECVYVSAHVCICSVSVRMPGCSCSIPGMLAKFSHLKHA